MQNFIPAKIENDTPLSYSVEYIFGKKCHHSSDAPLYAVKWEGYDKSEMTWEPQSSFSTEASILRFERCFCYKFYHTKVHQRKSNTNVRVHILRQYYQVHSIIESVNQKKQQQQQYQQQQQSLLIDSDSGDLFINENLKNEDDDVVDVDNYDKDIVFIRRGRGRPRKVDKEREMQALRNEFQVFRMDRPASQMELLQRAQMESQVNPFQPQSSYQNQMFFQHQNVLQRLKIKVERDYLNEIIQNSKQKEQAQQQIKRNPNDEAQENDATKKKNRETGILKSTGVQYETQEERPLPTFYDMLFEPRQLNQKLLFELILSHHLINNKLVFKCQTEQEQIYYAEYNVLVQKIYYQSILFKNNLINLLDFLLKFHLKLRIGLKCNQFLNFFIIQNYSQFFLTITYLLVNNIYHLQYQILISHKIILRFPCMKSHQLLNIQVILQHFSKLKMILKLYLIINNFNELKYMNKWKFL